MPRFPPLVAACLATALATTVAHAQEGYTNYDNFNAGDVIDPARWIFPERTRTITGGVLRLTQRDWGNQVDNSGVYANSWSTTLAVAPQLLRQLRATVKVNDTQVNGCAQNAEPSDVQARLIGAFFNTGTATPGNRTNDVFGLIRMIRRSNSTDPAGVLRVEGLVVRCLDNACVGPTVTLVGDIADMGTIGQGQTLQLRMDWDQAGNRFFFRRGTEAAVTVGYSGLVSVGGSPGIDFKGLQTRTILANCLSGNRTTGYIDAEFDNVFVNSSALP